MAKNKYVMLLEFINQVRGLDEVKKQQQVMGVIGNAARKNNTQLKEMGQSQLEAAANHKKFNNEVMSGGRQATQVVQDQQRSIREQTSTLASSIAQRKGHSAVIKDETRNLNNMGASTRYTSNQMQKGSIVTQKTAQKHNQLVARQRFVKKWMDKLGLSAQKVNMIMNKQGIIIKANGKAYNQAGQRIHNMNSRMREGEKQTRRFHMEWLSVMFAGMAMSRMLGGLIRKSMQMTGITELWGQVLGIFFLPVAMKLLDVLLPIFESIMNAPKWVKKLVGWFVVFGVIVGGILTVVGQLMLAIGGFKLITLASTIEQITGVKLAAKGATSKVGGLKTKLGKLARYGGAMIAVGFMLKDLKEEKVTSAIGDAMIGAGLLTGGKWAMYLIPIGIILKIIGEPEIMGKIYKLSMKIIDFVAGVGETIGDIIVAGFTGNWEKVDMGGFGKMSEEVEKAGEDMIKNYAFKSDYIKTVMEGIYGDLEQHQEEIKKKQEKINEKLDEGKISGGEYLDKVRELDKEMEKVNDKSKEFRENMNKGLERNDFFDKLFHKNEYGQKNYRLLGTGEEKLRNGASQNNIEINNNYNGVGMDEVEKRAEEGTRKALNESNRNTNASINTAGRLN